MQYKMAANESYSLVAMETGVRRALNRVLCIAIQDGEVSGTKAQLSEILWIWAEKKNGI